MTTPLISPSILNCDIARLEDELKKISSADIAHVDVMDNHFVPNLSLIHISMGQRKPSVKVRTILL